MFKTQDPTGKSLKVAVIEVADAEDISPTILYVPTSKVTYTLVPDNLAPEINKTTFPVVVKKARFVES